MIFNDINFDELEKYKVQGTKSTMYHNGEQCIKILDKLYHDEKEVLYKKTIRNGWYCFKITYSY